MTETDVELLRERGLRVTQGRIAVLEVLEQLPHADAEHVHAALIERGHDTSVQSVHNVLGDLTGAGILRRFEPERSAARYERRIDDNHHHAVCSSCGRVEDVDCVVGEAPCLHAQAPAGFTIQAANVTFVGLCAECAAAAAEAATATAGATA
ncbi:Fur family transcriptional regulator, ferric uptake regulator [Agrococcus baldri]|uniref:Fur family transcriptional regulator, ferric uptake regulator n=1 Tax=Agrococcus baldri TaxID=153730 RepID=A0AA94HMD7_9MICO|nr:Fur family transcriptional regulator [Agrococcus baldri]SFS10667.1 Fur family transcriptional regulator, ferric uptake regulator [Agrococcus baldri]